MTKSEQAMSRPIVPGSDTSVVSGVPAVSEIEKPILASLNASLPILPSVVLPNTVLYAPTNQYWADSVNVKSARWSKYSQFSISNDADVNASATISPQVLIPEVNFEVSLNAATDTWLSLLL